MRKPLVYVDLWKLRAQEQSSKTTIAAIGQRIVQRLTKRKGGNVK